MIVRISLDNKRGLNPGNDIGDQQTVIVELSMAVTSQIKLPASNQTPHLVEYLAHSAATRPACEWFA